MQWRAFNPKIEDGLFSLDNRFMVNCVWREAGGAHVNKLDETELAESRHALERSL